MHIKAVFFDFGGVITEKCSAPTVEEIITNFLKRKVIILSEKQCDIIRNLRYKVAKLCLSTLIEIILEKFLENVLDAIKYPKSVDLIQDCNDFFASVINRTLRENVREVLIELKNMGIKLGVISNSFINFPRRFLVIENFQFL